jgi:hypothetical protein
MARLTAKQQLKGIIGPTYIRQVNGMSVVQPRPKRPKQSKATRASSADFGLAVSQSRDVRIALRLMLAQGTDAFVSQRLTGALHKAFHVPQGVEQAYTWFTANLSSLIGFEFHAGSPLGTILPQTLPISITDTGCVALAPTSVRPYERNRLPSEAFGCELVFMVIGWTPDGNGITAPQLFKFEWSRVHANDMVWQTTPFPSGTRILVVAQLLYVKSRTVLGDKNYGNHKGFNPVRLLYTAIV